MQHAAVVQVDENGDDIVIEGIRDAKRTGCFLAIFYISLIVLTCGIGLFIIPCLIVANCFCAKNWKLYLTHTDIHYDPGCRYVLVPFNDINKISVIPGTKTILINKKQGSINELRIDSVTNCKEFVEAAKREMEMASSQKNF